MKPKISPSEQYETLAGQLEPLADALTMAAKRKEPEAIHAVLEKIEAMARQMKRLDREIKKGIPAQDALNG